MPRVPPFDRPATYDDLVKLPDNLVAEIYVAIPPDWTCEILSPSTIQIDRARKLGIYAREGVEHAWLVDPEARMLEVFRREAGRWVLLGAHAGNAVVRAEPFAEVDLELALLWAEPASPLS